MLIKCMEFMVETNNLTHVSFELDQTETGRADERAEVDTTWSVDKITFHFVNGEKLTVSDPTSEWIEKFECGEVAIQWDKQP